METCTKCPVTAKDVCCTFLFEPDSENSGIFSSCSVFFYSDLSYFVVFMFSVRDFTRELEFCQLLHVSENFSLLRFRRNISGNAQYQSVRIIKHVLDMKVGRKNFFEC